MQNWVFLHLCFTDFRHGFQYFCETHAKNRIQIGHFSWILERFSDDIWDISLDRLWMQPYGCNHPQTYFLIDVLKSHFLSKFEKVPKSMKNVRFGSGFLYVIRKMLPQQDLNVPITLKPSVSEIYKSASSYPSWCPGHQYRKPWFQSFHHVGLFSIRIGFLEWFFIIFDPVQIRYFLNF